MTSSPSAPSCCSARSPTPTASGSASSSPRPGIDSLLQVKVGDNLGRIGDVLRALLADADAVIVCGGLGPTHDDLTREAIAAVMGVELEPDEQVAEVIREMFAVARSAHGGEQPAPGAGAGGRHHHPADPRHRAGADLPGHRRRRARR